MFCFSALLLLAACLAPTYQDSKSKYCAIRKDHTMCKYSGVGKNCALGGSYGVTEKDKKEILNVHNYLRRKVAKGEEKRGNGGPQPKAANLKKFIWDNEIATIAQRWADQCTFAHDFRDVHRWKVGQNVYWMSKFPVAKPNWTEAIYSWYDEVSLFTPKDVSKYVFRSSTGHYTQMLWHDTYAVGCGRRDYGTNKIYVCNYGPTGNWETLPMYEIGKPCSKCPVGTVCENSLCATPTKEANPGGREFVTEFEPEKTNRTNPNAFKIYLVFYFKNKSFLRPISYLDDLYNDRKKRDSEEDLESEELKILEEGKEKIMEITKKIEKLEGTLVNKK